MCIVMCVCYLLLAQNEDEISCSANERVTIIEDLGDGWLKVCKGKEEGYVPQSYVVFNTTWTPPVLTYEDYVCHYSVSVCCY